MQSREIPTRSQKTGFFFQITHLVLCQRLSSGADKPLQYFETELCIDNKNAIIRKGHWI